MKIIFAILILLLSFSSNASELNDRNQIKQLVRTYFYKENFEQLERIAENFRINETRTSSGLWKLTLFYSGVSQLTSWISLPEQWDLVENINQKWLELYPDSPTPHIVQASILHNRAWFHRGNGWAHQIEPKNWKPFKKYLSLTRDYLEKNKSLASQDPQWYELMLRVATEQSWPLKDFLNLVEEGTSRYPYFYQIYFTGIRYLTPKWNGDKEKIENFANASVARTKKKEKMGMYARIYWVASQAQYGPRLFTDSAVVWKNMKKGILDVMEKYPDQWNTNNFAFFSCLAHDKAMTRNLIDEIKYPFIQDVWQDELIYNQCTVWANKDTNKIDSL